MLTITVLGTGTSQGVPVIGCNCEVCKSADPRDKRLRTSIMLEDDHYRLVIDAGPDFRQQMLREGVDALDALLLTHEHNDHVAGLDDVRPFNFMSGQSMPIFATERVQQSLRERYSYAFAQNPYPGAPSYALETIWAQRRFHCNNWEVTPVEVQHGKMPVLGFRFGEFTYITDAKTILPREKEKIKGTRVLMLNALHHNEHYSHMNLEQALALVEEIQPEKAWFIHISHRMGLHEKIDAQLPEHVSLAYDGLKIQL